MDEYQLQRHNRFLPYIQKESHGIEIGPGYRPTFPKSAGFLVTVVDHCETNELIAKYQADINVPKNLVEQIETVDVVWTGGDYKNLPGISDELDYIVACHVIEHTLDVCGFLTDCASLLKEEGVLLLAIPDRRCVLDYYRPLSTVGDVLLAHCSPTSYDMKSHLDEVWYGSLLDSSGAWSIAHLQEANRCGRLPLPQHKIDVAGSVWAYNAAKCDSNNTSKQGYRDAHRWVFEPTNFDEIVRFLEYAAATNLHMEAMPISYGCEFYAVLRKKTFQPNSDILEDTRLARYALQHSLTCATLNS